jgi:hypothetical protein
MPAWLWGAIALAACFGLLFKAMTVAQPAVSSVSGRAALEHLPLQARGVISTALGTGESRFDAKRTTSGYRLAGGGVVADLSGRGADLNAHSGTVLLSVQGVGRGNREALLRAGSPVAQRNRVVIHHGDVTEWYAAGPLGIEQGFTVAHRPSGAAGPMTLSLSVVSSLIARGSGAGLEFVDRSRGVVLQYGGLVAVDASGRALPASIVSHGGQLLLRVRDQGARYPVRIDPFVQQGSKLTGIGATSQAGFGWSVALSSDGNTALIGAIGDNNYGAAYVFTRTNGIWTQQAKLIDNCTSSCGGPNGTGAIGADQFGRSVALSADGNTALIGASADNTLVGAAWVFTRTNGAWSQQEKLVGNCTSSCAGNGTGEVGEGDFGWDVSLSADGNKALIGAPQDNSLLGAAWVFTRSGGTWSQLGSKLTGSGETPPGIYCGCFGTSVALSGNGSVALIGGDGDSSDTGAAWVFGGSGNLTQPDVELIGSCTGLTCGGSQGTGEMGAGQFGISVALSYDGSTALIGGFADNSEAGAAWVFTGSGGAWSQQGPKLTGASSGEINSGGAGIFFGWAVALSSDGNAALISGQNDNDYKGAAWDFTRSGTTWSQQGTKFIGDCTGTCSGSNGTGEVYNGWFGKSVALSADGTTALVGASGDNAVGAAWVFGPAQPGGQPPAGAPAVAGISPNSGPAGGGTHVTITGSHLTGATAVRFGSSNAASYTANNDGQITATVPAGAGTVDVTVTTAAGTSATSAADRFTYTNPHPNCSLKAVSSRVTQRKPTHGQKPGSGVLVLSATCDQNVHGILAVEATEFAHHRPVLFKLRVIGADFQAGVRQILKPQVPAALVRGLEHGLKESAAGSLIVGGRTVATTRITPLKL